MLAAGLTLYSGFGLGTLLLPAFSLFFPVQTAVAATAVVHGANNLFKLIVVGIGADRLVVIKFGLPAILAAFVGAASLSYFTQFDALTSYSIGSRTAEVTPLKLALGLMMILFALFELVPKLRGLRFDRKYLSVGGVLSGFFGGFSGHQGALRSAFLTKVGLSSESFIATNAVIGFLVDLTRLATYATLFLSSGERGISQSHWPLVLTGVVAAITGILIGKRFLHSVTMSAIQIMTGVLLLGIGLALGAGIL